MCAVLLLRWGLKSDWRKEKVSEIFKMKITTVLGGRNVNNLRYADDTTLMAESEEELKSLLMRVKEEIERADLWLNVLKKLDQGIWLHYCMANIRRKCRSSDRFTLGLQNHCEWWLQPWNQKTIVSWQDSYNKPRLCVEKQRHYSADKGPYR